MIWYAEKPQKEYSWIKCNDYCCKFAKCFIKWKPANTHFNIFQCKHAQSPAWCVCACWGVSVWALWWPQAGQWAPDVWYFLCIDTGQTCLQHEVLVDVSHCMFVYVVYCVYMYKCCINCLWILCEGLCMHVDSIWGRVLPSQRSPLLVASSVWAITCFIISK